MINAISATSEHSMLTEELKPELALLKISNVDYAYKQRSMRTGA